MTFASNISSSYCQDNISFSSSKLMNFKNIYLQVSQDNISLIPANDEFQIC